jgi:hypothetical protein
LDALEESTIETLSTVDIKSLSDLEADAERIIPPKVSNLEESDKISSEEATLLTILSWWYEGDNREFTNEETILHRYEQANYGFNQNT